MRTKVKTELQHLALNQGQRQKRRLWSVRGRADLEKLRLEGWRARRWADLLSRGTCFCAPCWWRRRANWRYGSTGCRAPGRRIPR